MSKSVFDKAADSLSPPYGSYRGRDTARFSQDFSLEPSMTRQEFADECDINVLMKKYEKTGLLPQNPDRPPFYVDAFDLPSYQEAHNMMIAASAAFAALPASVRKEYDNDPAKFVAASENADNLDQFEKWGLLSPEATAARKAAKEMQEADKAKPASPTPEAPKPQEKPPG